MTVWTVQARSEGDGAFEFVEVSVLGGVISIRRGGRPPQEIAARSISAIEEISYPNGATAIIIESIGSPSFEIAAPSELVSVIVQTAERSRPEHRGPNGEMSANPPSGVQAKGLQQSLDPQLMLSGVIRRSVIGTADQPARWSLAVVAGVVIISTLLPWFSLSFLGSSVSIALYRGWLGVLLIVCMVALGISSVSLIGRHPAREFLSMVLLSIGFAVPTGLLMAMVLDRDEFSAFFSLGPGIIIALLALAAGLLVVSIQAATARARLLGVGGVIAVIGIAAICLQGGVGGGEESNDFMSPTAGSTDSVDFDTSMYGDLVEVPVEAMLTVEKDAFIGTGVVEISLTNYLDGSSDFTVRYEVVDPASDTRLSEGTVSIGNLKSGRTGKGLDQVYIDLPSKTRVEIVEVRAKPAT